MSIGSIQRKIVHYLSGGEKRKVALAGAIVLEPDLLILDEPTESLGNEEEDKAIERLATTLSNLKTRQIIVITHDQTFAQFADNTIYVRKTENQSRFA